MFAKKKVSKSVNRIADLRIDHIIRVSLSSIVVASMLIISSQLLVGCLPKSNNATSAKAIIGQDRLTTVNVPKLLTTVGQLRIKDRVCSAYVSAPNQIVSATHCLIKGAAATVGEITFKTGDGKTTGIKRVIKWDPKRDIMTLETTESYSDHLEQGAASVGPITLVGYDANSNSLMYDISCSISDGGDLQGFVTHNCSSRPGFSGSPIMKNGVVVGLHLGYVEKINQNLALPLPYSLNGGIDVATTDLNAEGGIKFSPLKNPLDGVKIGTTVGTLLGGGLGSAVGASFGALIGKYNEMQDNIDRLKREGDQLQADLIQAKLDRSRDQEAAKNAATLSAEQLNCVNGRDNANTFFLGAIGKSQENFNNCLIAASDGPSSQSCLDGFQVHIKSQLDLAKQIYSCQ